MARLACRDASMCLIKICVCVCRGDIIHHQVSDSYFYVCVPLYYIFFYNDTDVYTKAGTDLQ